MLAGETRGVGAECKDVAEGGFALSGGISLSETRDDGYDATAAVAADCNSFSCVSGSSDSRVFVFVLCASSLRPGEVDTFSSGLCGAMFSEGDAGV